VRRKDGGIAARCARSVIVRERHSGNATLCELCIALAQFYLRHVGAQESRAKDTVKV